VETDTSHTPEANPDMSDQIIDALMARAIHADAARTHPLVGWIVMQDQPDYAGEMIARLVTDTPTPYVLRGHTLAEVQAQLPLRSGALGAATILPARGGGDLVSWVAGPYDQAGLTHSDTALRRRAFPGARLLPPRQ
jgi:hypothetical protein